jgi:hypothetical protein
MDGDGDRAMDSLWVYMITAYIGLVIHGVVYRVTSRWVPDTPTYTCSILHGASTVVLVALLTPKSPVGLFSPPVLLTATPTSAAILGLSTGFYVIDTLFEPNRLWIYHHFFAILAQVASVLAAYRSTGGTAFLAAAEVGALLYHISVRHKRSHLVRIVFLLIHGATRVHLTLMNTVGWLDVYRVARHNGPLWRSIAGVVEQGSITFAVCVNVWYFTQQLRAYRKHFWLPRPATYDAVDAPIHPDNPGAPPDDSA